MPKKLTIILIFLVMTGVVFWSLEKSLWFKKYRTLFQEQTVPAKLFEKGTFGKVLKELDLVRIESNSSINAGRRQDDNTNEKDKEVYICKTNTDRYKDFPSTISITNKKEINSILPVISVFSEHENLYGKHQGIITNFLQRGRDWERSAYVTYYDKNEILFFSGAGLRLHGGHSRKKKEKSFRLYFRNKYGIDRIKQGTIFSHKSGPTKTLVIHIERPNESPFTTSLAFDIAHQLGSLVPEVKLAYFFLNDHFEGVYWLSQHLSRRQWKTKFNNKTFLLYRQKATSDQNSKKQHYSLINWVDKANDDDLFNGLKQRINIERLTSNIIFTIFTGYTDGIQGIAIRDESKYSNKWDWVLWDVDTCFRDLERKGKRESWQQESIEIVINKPKFINDPQKYVFYRLINDSNEYKVYFIQALMESLNHKITEKFLNERVTYYKDLAARVKNIAPFNPEVEQFLLYRPDFVRNEIQRHFNLGKLVSCTVKNKSNIHLTIDGYPYMDHYNGRYLQGSFITASVIGKSRKNFSHWRINGKIVPGPDLKLRIVTDSSIEPVLNTKKN